MGGELFEIIFYLLDINVFHSQKINLNPFLLIM